MAGSGHQSHPCRYCHLRWPCFFIVALVIGRQVFFRCRWLFFWPSAFLRRSFLFHIGGLPSLPRRCRSQAFPASILQNRSPYRGRGRRKRDAVSGSLSKGTGSTAAPKDNRAAHLPGWSPSPALWAGTSPGWAAVPAVPARTRTPLVVVGLQIGPPSLSLCWREPRPEECTGLAFSVIPYSRDMASAVSYSVGGYQTWWAQLERMALVPSSPYSSFNWAMDCTYSRSVMP